jgi:hypothetical protein
MPIFHYKKKSGNTSTGFDDMGFAVPYDMASDAGCDRSMLPKDGLVFYAPLAEVSTTAETGQALTTSGNVTYSTVDGIPCAVFDGSSVITTEDNIAVSGTQPVSISGWIKSYGYLTEWPCAVMIGSESRALMLRLGTRYDFIYASGSGYDLISNIDATDKFHHVVATFDGDTMAYYIDGTFQGDMQAPLNIAVDKLFIGNSPSSHRFNGAVSSVRVYDRVLTDDEIKQLAGEFEL